VNIEFSKEEFGNGHIAFGGGSRSQVRRYQQMDGSRMAGERQLRRTKVGSRTMIRESELQRVIQDEPITEQAAQ
jgi:hypothetical protein